MILKFKDWKKRAQFELLTDSKGYVKVITVIGIGVIRGFYEDNIHVLVEFDMTSDKFRINSIEFALFK